MSARLTIAAVIGILLNLVLLSARSSQPPVEQIEAAKAIAEMSPTTPFPCKPINERTCVSLDLWVQIMGPDRDVPPGLPAPK